MQDIREQVERAAEMLARNQPALAFSGAGMSAESGIPTFRGDEGIWKEFAPALYGNIPGLAVAFLLRPGKLARFFLGVLEAFLDSAPNQGHAALAELSRRGLLGPVITQNIDNMHQQAGSPDVIELHGSLNRWRCLRCGRKIQTTPEDFQPIRDILARHLAGRADLIGIARRHLPRCPACKGRMRPDVVFFGESLPRAEYSRAVDECMRCSTMLVLGTSGVVYPAAAMPQAAKRSGAAIIEVNPEPTALTRIADIFVPAPVGEALPMIAEAAAGLKEEK